MKALFTIVWSTLFLPFLPTPQQMDIWMPKQIEAPIHIEVIHDPDGTSYLKDKNTGITYADFMDGDGNAVDIKTAQRYMKEILRESHRLTSEKQPVLRFGDMHAVGSIQYDTTENRYTEGRKLTPDVKGPAEILPEAIICPQEWSTTLSAMDKAFLKDKADETWYPSLRTLNQDMKPFRVKKGNIAHIKFSPVYHQVTAYKTILYPGVEALVWGRTPRKTPSGFTQGLYWCEDCR